MATSIARRGLVMAAAVLGLMAVLAPPAGADPVIEGVVTLGQFEFDVPSEPTSCPMAQSLPITFAGDASNGTWDAGAGSFKLPFSFFGTSYQIEVDFLPTSVGTYTQTSAGPPPTYDLDGRLDIRIYFQQLTSGTDPGTCTKTNLCTMQARLPMPSSSNYHVGSLPTPTTGDATAIDASSLNSGGINIVNIGSCPVTVQALLVGRVAAMTFSLGWP